MERIEIPFEDFDLNIVKAWAKDWYLLAAGVNEPGGFNMMTVAWGSFGVMWGKPFAQIVVRPSRYTYEFLEQHDTFTLTAFPDENRKVLNFCGSKSGRDFDKVAETGLTPIASQTIECPGFDEAELIIECKKIYFDDFEPKQFLHEDIEPCYNGGDYHRSYYGEISHIAGTEKYKA